MLCTDIVVVVVSGVTVGSVALPDILMFFLFLHLTYSDWPGSADGSDIGILLRILPTLSPYFQG
jgi:hypothetical protein